ncbi:MAG: tyrosine--tRNA ligase [Candidatus Liptonbacteria bacterium]|nr:tyrosine--tRNA ligase [Candidatus Liptonbacteria bacterium]
MKVITDEKLIEEALSRGVEEVIEKDHLKKAMLSGRQLRIKLGIDPTSPDIHLGHLVVLLKLRQFERLGHKLVLIIGDFTAKIGDPSGRSETRKPLTDAEIKKNFKKYKDQISKILNLRKAEICYNGKWFKKGGIKIMIELASSASLQQVLRRADFSKRIEEGNDVTMLEAIYPLFQGYDSVAVSADVELGGTDQKFNLLMGRRIQRFYNRPEQDVLMTPLLEGTDGVRKMSKSYGNYIGVDEEPNEMFAKVMSVPDALLKKYFELLTDLDFPENQPLYEAKLVLAQNIVTLCHNAKAGEAARENFKKVFSKKEIPEDAPELILKEREISAVDLILLSGVAESRGEAKRLIEQGALEVGGRVERDVHSVLLPQNGDPVRIGKKYFARIKAPE